MITPKYLTEPFLQVVKWSQQELLDTVNVQLRDFDQLQSTSFELHEEAGGGFVDKVVDCGRVVGLGLLVVVVVITVGNG